MPPHAPTVMLRQEETVYGPVYHPANPLAKTVANLVGSSAIPHDRIEHVRALGLRVEIVA